MEKLLTPNEAADILRISVYTLLEYARKGTVPAIKVGREWRFVEKDLDAWLKERRTGSTYGPPEGGYSLARDAAVSERETEQDKFIKEMVARRRKAWEELKAFRSTLKPMNIQKMLEEIDEEREERYDRWLGNKKEKNEEE